MIGKSKVSVLLQVILHYCQRNTVRQITTTFYGYCTKLDILHVIALAFLLIQFVLNYYRSWRIKMSGIIVPSLISVVFSFFRVIIVWSTVFPESWTFRISQTLYLIKRDLTFKIWNKYLNLFVSRFVIWYGDLICFNVPIDGLVTLFTMELCCGQIIVTSTNTVYYVN